MLTKSLEEARYRLLAALLQRDVKATLSSFPYDIVCYADEAKFSLSFMPGNRRTLISHDVEVYETCRRRGVGTRMCALREEAAREAGVTLILATVKDDNVAEVKILEKGGWSRLTQNSITGCSLWGKQL